MVRINILATAVERQVQALAMGHKTEVAIKEHHTRVKEHNQIMVSHNPFEANRKLMPFEVVRKLMAVRIP